MTRGRFGTPRSTDAVGVSGEVTSPVRVLVYEGTGYSVRAHIDPRQFRLSELAAELADAAMRVSAEIHGSTMTLATAVKNFLTCMDEQLVSAANRQVGLAQIRRRHLDAWERELGARQHRDRSDTTYRYVVHVFALLRRIEADRPGALHSEVVKRLEDSTRLNHVRREGDAEFAPAEVRRMRSAAHRIVHRALEEERAGYRGAPTKDVVLALQVLLVLSTGEPIEVIRRVTMNDLTASTASAHDHAVASLDSVARTQLLARAGVVDSYALSFYKARAGEAYTEVYDRTRRSARREWNAAVVLTAAAREETGAEALWLTASPRGPRNAPYPEMNLGKWAARHVVDFDALSRPVVFRRLRKTQITKEILAGPSRYLRDGRRHSDATFFGHYANSTVLRGRAGRILVDSIGDRFDAALAGPTLITPDAEELLVGRHRAPTLTGKGISALQAGAWETPMAACRDPLSSPHAPAGHACTVTATGACFACPNAIVLERHLPAALRLLELTEPARAANIEVWQRQWKPIHDSIRHAILPAFPKESIARAAEATGAVLVDAGLLNDLAGLDDH